jgi:hypothetical protein
MCELALKNMVSYSQRDKRLVGQNVTVSSRQSAGSLCSIADTHQGQVNLLTLNLPTTTIVAQPFLKFC